MPRPTPCCTPVIVEAVAVQDVTTQQTEPRVTLFASDPARLHGFGDIRARGETVSLADLQQGEIYLNADGAEALHASAGTRFASTRASGS